MNAILFHLKRALILLADVALFPLHLWDAASGEQTNRKALLFGLPALLLSLLLVGMTAVYLLGDNERREQAYRLLAEDTQRRAKQYLDDNDMANAMAEANRAELLWKKARQFDQRDYSYVKHLYQLAVYRVRAIRRQLQEASTADREPLTAQLRDAKNRAEIILKQMAPDDTPTYVDGHIIRAATYLNRIRSDDADDRLDRGTALNAAEQQLELALQLDSNNSKTALLYADVKAMQGRLEEALQIYQRHYRDYPDYSLRIIQVLAKMERESAIPQYVDVAIEAYGERMEQNPFDMGTFEKYMRLYMVVKRFEQAEQLCLDKARQITQASADDPELPYEKSRLEREINIVLGQLYSIWAQDGWAVQNLQGTLESEAPLDRALELLKRTLQVDPFNRRARLQLTQIGLQENPGSQRAQQLYDPRRDPQQATAEELRIVGSHEIQYGDKQLGIELLKLAVEKDPEDAIAANNLAYAVQLDDLEYAKQLANAAVNSDASQPNFRDTRGSVYARAGDYAQAVSDLEIAVKKLPQNATTSRVLIQCLQQLGMEKEAAYVQREFPPADSPSGDDTEGLLEDSPPPGTEDPVEAGEAGEAGASESSDAENPPGAGSDENGGDR